VTEAFTLKKLGFPLGEIKKQVELAWPSLNWQKNQVSGEEHRQNNDGRYHNGGHGTLWCYIGLPASVLTGIEKTIGAPIYRERVALWDYKDVKTLPLHIDTEEINFGKRFSAVLPITGRFKLSFYEDIEKKKPAGECTYGPGELVIINNCRYFHEGIVLDETRLGLHFFLD